MNDRQLKIIGFLLKNTEKISTKDLADKFSVSRRTIFNDLNIMEKYLESNSYQLIRNDGNGIYINKKDNETNKILDFKEFFQNNRILNIIRLILFEDKKDIFDISEDLYISESTLTNDIDFINKTILSSYNLSLEISNYRIRISGKELEIQNFYLLFNQYLLEEINKLVIDDDMAQENFNHILKSLYGDKIVSISRKILYKFIYKNTEKLAEYYFSNIINSFIVLIYRKSKKKEIKFDNNSKDENNDASNLIKEFEKEFSYKFNISEKTYIYDVLKANKMANINNYEDDKLVNSIIDDISNILEIDFRSDVILYKQLKNYIPSMIYRLKNSVLIDNPFLTEIKKEYHIIFSSIWMSLMQNNYLKKINLNDQEVGLLTIYIQSAIDRNKSNKLIALYNNNNMVDSNFIFSRINNILNNNLTLKLEKSLDSLKKNLNSYKIILTTDRKLNLDHKNIIRIPAVLKNIDLIKLNQNINNVLLSDDIYDYKNEVEIKNTINKYFIEDTTKLNLNFNNKNELLDYALDYLIEKDYVNKSYKDSVINREKLGNTELGDFLVIPHGSPEDVKKSCIFFIGLKESLFWNENNIKIVAIMNVNNKDYKDLRNILKIIDKIAYDKNYAKNILNSKNYKEFKNTVLNKLRGENLWAIW